MTDIILTCDVGTTGNKCTFFDFTGKILCAHTQPYETLFPFAGQAEQRPQDFWHSVVAGTRALLEKSGVNPTRVAVIGLSGHMNGCLPVDSKGKPLYNDILHSDSRSTAECALICEAVSAGDYYRITGIRPDAHYTLPKILWLKKNHPDVYKKTAFFLASKDYVGFKLTGKLGFTDYSDASMTAVFDVDGRCWSESLCRELDVDLAKLPTVLRSADILGSLTCEAAALLGLPAGIPVAAGGGDAACATRGAGVARLGQGYNYIGSSSWISVLREKPVLDREARLFNFYDLDGISCNSCGTVQCATVSYDWVLRTVAAGEIEACKNSGENVYDFIDSRAALVPPGSNGLFFLPYFMGERTPSWDENTKGCFIGMNLNTSREELLRAAYEGIAYALRSVLEIHGENGFNPENIALIGGGAISPFWNEIMCNVFALPVRIHQNPREATSLGAAFAAGVAAGVFADFNQAASAVVFNRSVLPEDRLVKLYENRYAIYQGLYPALKESFAGIAALAR